MNYFFTADTHFFHRNILKYARRPFASIEAMHEAYLERWNARVGKNDRVYHLGDLSFGGLAETFRLLAELNGEICLLQGNHDDDLVADDYLRSRFHWIKPYHEEEIEGRLVVMCHYPIAQWRGAQRGSWHLHGHTHGCVQLEGAALDVGIDVQPNLWSWAELKARLEPIRPLPYPRRCKT